MLTWELLKYIKLSCRPLTFALYKPFLNNEKGSGISLPASLSAWFSKKKFILLFYVNWPDFIAWLFLLCEILGNMWIVIVCKPRCDVINYEINLIFLIQPFFPTWPKIRDKNLNIFRTKRAFKMKKDLPIIFKREEKIIIKKEIK